MVALATQGNLLNAGRERAHAIVNCGRYTSRLSEIQFS
jgi:hypothetical protein